MQGLILCGLAIFAAYESAGKVKRGELGVSSPRRVCRNRGADRARHFPPTLPTAALLITTPSPFVPGASTAAWL